MNFGLASHYNASANDVGPRMNNVIAGATMIMMALVSCGINISVLVIVAKNHRQKFGYAFGKICLFHTIANLANSLIFVFLVGPITIIKPSLHKLYITQRTGQALLCFWNASVLTHFLTAFNRFVIISFPLKYAEIFTRTFTLGAIAVAWTLSFLKAIPYFWPECTFGYQVESNNFRFSDTTCGFIVGTMLEFYLSIGVVLLIAILDFVTFCRIRTTNKKMNVNASEHERRRKREIRFFFQACFQGIAFISELTVYFYISEFFEAQSVIHFLLTTGAWIGVHIIDGLIVIAFNHEFRRWAEMISFIPKMSDNDGDVSSDGSSNAPTVILTDYSNSSTPLINSFSNSPTTPVNDENLDPSNPSNFGILEDVSPTPLNGDMILIVSPTPTMEDVSSVDDDDERLSISNMELVDEVNSDDDDESQISGSEAQSENFSETGSLAGSEIFGDMSERTFDQVSRELRTLQFRNPGEATPDGFSLMTMSIGQGRMLRSASLVRSETPDSISSVVSLGHEADSLTHDQDGRILNVFTGEMVYMCDCFDLECPGCQMECETCHSRRCYFLCQRGRLAFVWFEGNRGVKRRNPFIKQIEDEAVERKIKWRD
ncbi:hypothetical protein QR680_003098 [Steinernema hermaphroditum]|uniref:G-protein coupled receptors family 1 profile domain-containing protein n=1 Tax=Steinernema hermaphroditum TaxID=289476 RepID=A0AA39H7K9_9BILA|nr:hypothetical protein QR680_003098 [Steinernema hermaphroditum]